MRMTGRHGMDTSESLCYTTPRSRRHGLATPGTGA